MNAALTHALHAHMAAHIGCCAWQECPGKRSMPGVGSAQGTSGGLAAPLVVQGRGVDHTGLTQQVSQGIVHSAETGHCLQHHVLALLHPDHLLHLLPGL